MRPGVKVAGLCIAGIPAGWLLVAALHGALGPNPAEALIRSTGDWALRFLCLALAVTPLRVTASLPALASWRRSVGLTAFAYAALHAMGYAFFDQGLDLAEMARDIAKRPFILVGFLSFILLITMAATSFNGAVRRLGAARWKLLHRSVYAVALLVILHFFWMRAGKRDFAEVAIYAAVIAALLAWRIWRRWAPAGPGGLSR